jgi:hypothetical protein
MELGAFMGWLMSPRYSSRAPPQTSVECIAGRRAATVYWRNRLEPVFAQVDARAALTEGQGYGDKDHFR